MTGSWTDVFVLPDGRLGQVAVDGAAVSCEIEGIPTWTQRASEPLMFCRCAVHQGLVLSIHQGHDTGRAWLVGSGMVRDLGPTFGVQPVAIDSRFAYVVRSGYSYDQIDLESGETITHASPVPGSSQGISDVNPTDGLWWADLHRSIVVNGETLTYPNTRTPVTVGQADPPSIRAAIGGKVWPVFFGDGYEPHVAVSGPRAAVCARTPHGAAYVLLDIVVLQREPGPIVNQPKEEPPMQAKPLPADVHAIVVALHARNLTLAHGSADDRRALQKKICETVRARKGERWGWKSNHGVNIANAKDAIAELPDGHVWAFGDRQPLYIWDLFNGGTRAPNPVPVMSETEHIEQFFVPVEPIDHLAGSVTEPEPVKPPPGDTPVDLAPLAARIAALEAATRKNSGDTLRLAETVDILKSRPAPSFDLEAALAGYEVSGRTGRDRLGLQHDVRLGITKRTS